MGPDCSGSLAILQGWKGAEYMQEPVIVSLRGEYDIDRVSVLRAELERYYEHPYVVVDLTQLE